MAVARVHVRSWQVAYCTLLPSQYLDQLRPEERASKYDFATPDPSKPQTIVASDRGLVYGFATTAPSQDADMAGQGELCALYVDPEYWGRGIGTALTTAARARLIEFGFRSAMLWVLMGNARAEQFYAGDRWFPDGQRRTDIVWGVTVDEVRYVRTLEVSSDSECRKATC